MTIYRGVGGGGDATTDAQLSALITLSTVASNAAIAAQAAQSAATTQAGVATTQAGNASASASAAAASAAAALALTGTVPSQTGNAGKFLTTNGTNTSYAAVPYASVTGTPTLGTAAATDSTAYVSSSTNIGFKNRIINGAMVIDQRNAGASVPVTASAPFTVDRWQSYGAQSGKINVQQTPSATETGFATRVGAGFTSYLACTSQSAYTVGSSEYFNILQSIEGLNISDLAWGTANAKTITISFLAYSSLTGTFGGAINNSAVNRSYPFTYTINSANTWEQKSITIAGDTSGTWLTTNGVGMYIRFNLGAGATLSGTAGAWVGAALTAPTGATSVVGTNGATFYITGVQLEKGSTATAFDYRDYGRELIMCQRYFSKIGGTTSTEPVGTGNIQDVANSAWVYVKFPTTMRAAPTLAYSQLQIVNNASYALAVSSIRGQYAGLDSANFGVNCSSNGTTFAAVQLQTSATAGYLSMSAEL